MSKCILEKNSKDTGTTWQLVMSTKDTTARPLFLAGFALVIALLHGCSDTTMVLGGLCSSRCRCCGFVRITVFAGLVGLVGAQTIQCGVYDSMSLLFMEE